MSGAYKVSLKTVTAECGQIVMKSGSTVQTNVTAAMSDDSFYDLTNATVTYESNRPSVATVDKEGLVTITGVGTATITANVTINGITASGSYPIKVRPDLSLNSITLNGQELSDFNANIHGYSVLLADDQDKAPQVEAKQADASVKLAIDQAKSLPGTARIALTDDITGEEAIYTVAFGFKSESDEFNSTTLGSQWSWVREDDTKWSLTESPGSLQITLQEGDISDTLATAKNILLQDANTDWTMESKLVFSQKPSAFGQQGGLIAYQDDDNYVKLVYDYTLSGYRPAERFELIFESNGFQINGGAINARSIVKENNTVVFKLEKKGISYTAYYSTDGNNFTPLGTVEAELSDVKAGLIAFAGTGEGRRLMFMMPPESTPETGPEIDFNMAFDYFHIENTGIELP
jgi:beta-glucosidase